MDKDSDNSDVLSTEEVDAILKVAQEQGESENPLVTEDDSAQQQTTLQNINEVIRAECEKALSAFFRKKIAIQVKNYHMEKLSRAIAPVAKQHVFAIFNIQPDNQNGLFILDLAFIHQAINILFGSQVNVDETIVEKPGKIGVITTEKVAKVCLSNCAEGFREYLTIQCDVIKGSAIPIFSPYIDLDDKIYMIELAAFFDNLETSFYIAIPELLIREKLPKLSMQEYTQQEHSWHNVIKSQVLDSIVTLTASLPETNMALKNFMTLKEGDVIHIDEPTQVFLSINNVKLYRANAGQANNIRVAKILEKI